MKAMILAAGLGTRLKPLTDDRPKALVSVGGKTLLEWTLLKLKAQGYQQIVLNIHHFGQQILDFLDDNEHFGLEIAISDEREALLDTGGGLYKAASLLRGTDDFLLCNADILTDFDLSTFRAAHHQSGALVTLAVSQRSSSRMLVFDERNLLCGWKNRKTGAVKQARPAQGKVVEMAFSGYHYLHPEIFPLIEERGCFSIIDLYLRLARDHEIRAFDHSGTIWADMGKPEALQEGAALLTQMTWSRQVQDSVQD